MKNTFDGKVVIVTGGTRGIGRAIVDLFAREGASLVVAGTTQSKADAVAEEVGNRALGVKVDVADQASCQAMVDKTLAHFGRLDILVNNAGISGTWASTGERSASDWQRVIDVNLTGVFYCTHAAIPHIQSAGGGVIINISSVDGLVGMAALQHYSAAKHGVIGMTKSVALEYGRDNIRVVAVAPGFIATEMTEDTFSQDQATHVAAMTALGRPAQPEEVGNMVVWLASDEASYVTGCCLQVDGGLLSGFGALA